METHDITVANQRPEWGLLAVSDDKKGMVRADFVRRGTIADCKRRSNPNQACANSIAGVEGQARLIDRDVVLVTPFVINEAHIASQIKHDGGVGRLDTLVRDANLSVWSEVAETTRKVVNVLVNQVAMITRMCADL